MKTLTYSETFIDSLSLSVECQNIAKVLLTTKQHCEEFYVSFLGRNRYKVDDLLDYREYRLSIREINVEQFLIMCNNKVKIEVFEEVFLQQFNAGEIELIQETINKGGVSLELIFRRFQKNVNENILKNVL